MNYELKYNLLKLKNMLAKFDPKDFNNETMIIVCHPKTFKEYLVENCLSEYYPDILFGYPLYYDIKIPLYVFEIRLATCEFNMLEYK